MPDSPRHEHPTPSSQVGRVEPVDPGIRPSEIEPGDEPARMADDVLAHRVRHPSQAEALDGQGLEVALGRPAPTSEGKDCLLYTSPSPRDS